MRLLHRRAPVVAVTTVAALVLGACTAAVETGRGSADRSSAPASAAPRPSGSGAAANPTPAKVTFKDCSSLFNLGALTFPAGRKDRLSFDCATLNVPLDYADPTGRTIGLQLVRVHDSANKSHTGSLLVNPGGPGGSGVELVVSLAAQVSDKLLSHFDLIGFDPRGVGLSTPVKCLTNAEKDKNNAASPDVRSPTGFAAAKAAAAAIANACERKLGAQLPYFNTVQTAKDMEQIRAAVGDPKFNYLGFSYGTELGAAYAHLYPQRIRAMVLDGAVDPLTNGITAFANQLQGFEGSFDQFASWCKVHSPCKTLGNARQAVYSIAAQATKSPIPSNSPGEDRKATSALVYTGVLSALYSQDQWPSLASALIAARKNDSSGLLRLADQYNERYQGGEYSNIYDANTTISCNDSKPGPSDATIKATTAQWATKYPMFGLWSAAALFSCQDWQGKRTVPPLPTAPTAARPILVVGNLHDPATPYQGAKDLTKTLGRAQLLTWDGEGHTSYLQSSCIDGYVDDYLVSGTLPPANKICPR